RLEERTGGVDAKRISVGGGKGIVGGGVSPSAVEEAVDADAVAVIADDLAHIVDARRDRAGGGQGIVEGRVTAAAFEEAVVAAGDLGIPDDLAGGVEARLIGGVRW